MLWVSLLCVVNALSAVYHVFNGRAGVAAFFAFIAGATLMTAIAGFVLRREADLV